MRGREWFVKVDGEVAAVLPNLDMVTWWVETDPDDYLYPEANVSIGSFPGASEPTRHIRDRWEDLDFGQVDGHLRVVS